MSDISYKAKINSQSLTDYMQERALWYSSNNIVGLMEAVKYLKNRELMFLKGIKVRWLYAGNFNFLLKILRTFSIDLKQCCAYASLDKYDYIPMFTSNLKNRTKEANDYFETNPLNITGCDFGIDIDFKQGNWKDAKEILFYLLKPYQDSGVLYSIWKTTHGFHIVIPSDESKEMFKSVQQQRDFYYLIAEKLSKTFPQIDLSAYMETRVFRCPYMLDADDEVTLPLKYEELNLLFDGKIQTRPKWVLKNIRLMNRGTFLNGTTGNFKKFVECVENGL